MRVRDFEIFGDVLCQQKTTKNGQIPNSF